MHKTSMSMQTIAIQGEYLQPAIVTVSLSGNCTIHRIIQLQLVVSDPSPKLLLAY